MAYQCNIPGGFNYWMKIGIENGCLKINYFCAVIHILPLMTTN